MLDGLINRLGDIRILGNNNYQVKSERDTSDKEVEEYFVSLVLDNAPSQEFKE
jgi:hypothetical protein